MLLAFAVQAASAHAEASAVGPKPVAAAKAPAVPVSSARPAMPEDAIKPVAPKSGLTSGISFVYTAPAVGNVETVVDDLVTDMAFQVGTDKVKMQSTRTKKYTVKTLVAANNKVSKVEVVYALVQENKVINGKAEKTAEVNSGKSYWVEADAAGKLTVTSTKGEKVADAEATIVSKDFDEALANMPRMSRIIGNKSWVLKAKNPMTAADFAILNEKEDSPKGSEGFITLMSKNAKTSVFVVEMVAVMKNGSVDFTLPGLRLEAIVDTNTLRPTQVKMISKVKGTVNGMPVDGSIKGLRVSKMKLK